MTGRPIVSGSSRERGGHARPQDPAVPGPRPAAPSGPPDPVTPTGRSNPVIPTSPDGPAIPVAPPGPVIPAAPLSPNGPAAPGLTRRARPARHGSRGSSGSGGSSGPGGVRLRPPARAREPAVQARAARRVAHRRRRGAGHRPGHRLRLGAVRGAHRPGVPARLAAAALRRRGLADLGRAGYRRRGPEERLRAARRHPAVPDHGLDHPARQYGRSVVHRLGRSGRGGTGLDLPRPVRAERGRRHLEGAVGARAWSTRASARVSAWPW